MAFGHKTNVRTFIRTNTVTKKSVNYLVVHTSEGSCFQEDDTSYRLALKCNDSKNINKIRMSEFL